VIVGSVFCDPSDRRSCAECKSRWSTGKLCKLSDEDNLPDHSVFGRARQERFRDGDVLRRVCAPHVGERSEKQSIGAFCDKIAELRFLAAQTSIANHLTHVFVDEFQDNNPIQFAIHTGWLNRPDMRLTVVGDDDQAIYRFRGSDIECFNQLQPYCDATKVPYRAEKLETNYRSTKSIVCFTQQFRSNSVLESLSMEKKVVAAPEAPKGTPVRSLEGPWPEVAKCVAAEPAWDCVTFSVTRTGTSAKRWVSRRV
jgi:hypothetical protein